MNRQPHPYSRGELVVVIDCAGLERAARFWTAVLGYITTGNPDGNEFCVLQPLPHPAQS